MSRKTIIWLIIAAFLLLIGCMILGGVMTMLQWDFSKLSTVKYETNEYRITEQFERISIVTDTTDILFAPAKDEICTVVCYEQESRKHSVTVQDGALVIQEEDPQHWYASIGIQFRSPKITVYLPQSQYRALTIRSDTGDVKIPEDFTFENVDVYEDTGDVTCFASASGMIKIKTSTGKIHVENASANALDLSVSTGNVTVSHVNCAGDLTVKVSTGKAVLSETKCQNLYSGGNTGDITLRNVMAAGTISIERSTGDVKLDGVDAAELFITTDTGSITGTLLSEKVFLARSDTGRVNVPKTTSGGRCEISTDTGNIVIEIAKAD